MGLQNLDRRFDSDHRLILRLTPSKRVPFYIMPVWRNWQTRGIQNPVPAMEYRFDPDHR
ncbi:hypothetical protein FD51_GL002022 [Lacticaseibacillus zeae DSM 20178 = KCTC 3804]|uniref:Uncharacterized protein n=1 Tax=Lacticaseibacillus zeae DSM 20178 = KCTC 3804 TaxID=1423816 RepID=A0A0R1ER56_LACZE|nr:hypothetical protein FD51_GL002022 [Lacticaseibacillus zeae DSM 20178 = KCTC 3804]